jgi:hypothetical protein
MVSGRAYAALLRSAYFNVFGQKIASSRTKPQDPVTAKIPVGAWRIDDTLCGCYGHEVEQLREMDVSTLVPAEDTGPERQADVQRYAQWIREGKQPPPIDVIECENGSFKIVNGHRRWLAAQQAGNAIIQAWVSPIVEVLSPNVGQLVKTGLTYELAQAKALMESSGALTDWKLYHAPAGTEMRYAPRPIQDGEGVFGVWDLTKNEWNEQAMPNLGHAAGRANELNRWAAGLDPACVVTSPLPPPPPQEPAASAQAMPPQPSPEPSAQAGPEEGGLNAVKVEYRQTKHTKTGADLWQVCLAQRVERPVYEVLNASAKENGGWYSTFARDGARPGWYFKDPAHAEAFLQAVTTLGASQVGTASSAPQPPAEPVVPSATATQEREGPAEAAPPLPSSIPVGDEGWSHYWDVVKDGKVDVLHEDRSRAELSAAGLAALAKAKGFTGDTYDADHYAHLAYALNLPKLTSTEAIQDRLGDVLQGIAQRVSNDIPVRVKTILDRQYVPDFEDVPMLRLGADNLEGLIQRVSAVTSRTLFKGGAEGVVRDLRMIADHLEAEQENEAREEDRDRAERYKQIKPFRSDAAVRTSVAWDKEKRAASESGFVSDGFTIIHKDGLNKKGQAHFARLEHSVSLGKISARTYAHQKIADYWAAGTSGRSLDTRLQILGLMPPPAGKDVGNEHARGVVLLREATNPRAVHYVNPDRLTFAMRMTDADAIHHGIHEGTGMSLIILERESKPVALLASLPLDESSPFFVTLPDQWIGPSYPAPGEVDALAFDVETKTDVKVEDAAPEEPPVEPSVVAVEEPPIEPKDVTVEKTPAEASEEAHEPGTRKDDFRDVGEKIGGARKDLAALRAKYKDKGVAIDLDDLRVFEHEDASMASLLVTRDQQLGKRQDFLKELKEAGQDPRGAYIASRLFTAIKNPKDTAEDREAFVKACARLKSMVLEWQTFGMARDGFARIGMEADRRGIALFYSAERRQELDRLNTCKQGVYKELISLVKAGEIRQPKAWTFSDAEGLTERSKEKLRALDETDRRIKEVTELAKAEAQDEARERLEEWQSLGPGFVNLVCRSDSRNALLDLSEKKSTWDWAFSRKTSPVDEGEEQERKVSRYVWTREVPEAIERVGGEAKVWVADSVRDTFKFRGIEYGIWQNLESAQGHTQAAGDALVDLADLLGVHPEHLSLEGRLGLAFGARGSGKASAHYEPVRRVINLTKTRGGGSLAHEWAHALDNYVAWRSTERSSHHLSFVSDMKFVPPGGTLHEDVAKAFAKVGKAITTGQTVRTEPMVAEPTQLGSYRPHAVLDQHLNNNRGDADAAMEDYRKALLQRPGLIHDLQFVRLRRRYNDHLIAGAQYLAWRAQKPVTVQLFRGTPASNFVATAEGMPSDYWSRPHELFARAFEAYVWDTLDAKGQKNTYLVSGCSEASAERFRESAAVLEAGGGRTSIYPLGDERKAINEAMSELMKALAQHVFKSE